MSFVFSNGSIKCLGPLIYSLYHECSHPLHFVRLSMWIITLRLYVHMCACVGFDIIWAVWKGCLISHFRTTFCNMGLAGVWSTWIQYIMEASLSLSLSISIMRTTVTKINLHLPTNKVSLPSPCPLFSSLSKTQSCNIKNEEMETQFPQQRKWNPILVQHFLEWTDEDPSLGISIEERWKPISMLRSSANEIREPHFHVLIF